MILDNSTYCGSGGVPILLSLTRPSNRPCHHTTQPYNAEDAPGAVQGAPIPKYRPPIQAHVTILKPPVRGVPPERPPERIQSYKAQPLGGMDI